MNIALVHDLEDTLPGDFLYRQEIKTSDVLEILAWHKVNLLDVYLDEEWMTSSF